MVFFVMSINATPAGSPEVSRSATAVKSCRYALSVCADGLRVARSFRKSANQFGVAAAVSASDADARPAAPASPGASAAATGGSSLMKRRGTFSSVTEKRWIIALIHQTWGNRCRTVSLSIADKGSFVLTVFYGS